MVMLYQHRLLCCCSCLSFVAFASAISAIEWPQFRGPQGAGKAVDETAPLKWSDDENLKWKTELPGPGSSSPIIVGDRMFVTCYSGYGTGGGGSIDDLKRHLICIDRHDGKVQWDKTVDAEKPEDSYRGFINEHGYASNTPVCDGERVFAFFGKSGVVAFDMEGKQLWKVGVGKESSNRRWGSAASLILYKDTVIVNAAEESRTIRALDAATGKEKWKAEGGSLELCFSTPALVKLKDDTEELVIPVPGEVWGLNPDTGKLKWHCDTNLTGNISPSIVSDGEGVVYVFGGYQGKGSMAIRAGGDGDVTDTQVVWSSRITSYVPSPLVHGEHLWCVDDRGIVTCMKLKDGEEVYRRRVEGAGGGFISRPFYASVVMVGDRLYIPSRNNGTYVIAAKTEFEQLGLNKFASDKSDFNATPAVADGNLFLRSNKFVYCVGEK